MPHIVHTMYIAIMTPKKKLNKDELVPVRMDARLKKKAQIEADKRDISLSQYIRILLKKDLGEN